MTSSYSLYSTQLAEETQTRWIAAGLDATLLPPEDVLIELMDISYQASLLREEGDPVRCRIVIGSPNDFQPSSNLKASQLTTLGFRDRPVLSPHQIRKLAAAAGFYRSLLAVEVSRPKNVPRIWGIVNSGTRWVNRIASGRQNEIPLPPNLVLQIVSPGHLIISSGDNRLFETAGGILLADGFDPFFSDWLPERFRSVRAAMLKSQAMGHPLPTTQICDSFVKNAAQSVIRRAIGIIRTRRHGGTLAYICDQEDAESVAARWFRFRVLFQRDEGAERFQCLMRRLIKRLIDIGSSRKMTVVTWKDYQRIVDAEVHELDEALIEFADVLADFMSVDGALVLDRAFRVIGFGAEILGDSPIAEIHRALDLEAERTIAEPADSSGTRHRAAYRLVSGVPDVIALIVSQDGAVRFVANHRQKLTYWPYLP